MSISFWRRLTTPVKQLIILLLLVLLLLLFLMPLSIMSTRRVQACLDNELYHQTLALRGWFVDELYYLRDEAKLLSEFEAFDDAIDNHDDVQCRRLMAAYQNAHDADGIYLITEDGKVHTSSTSPPLDAETVMGLDLVQKGANGQSVAEIVTIDEKIWLMAASPHTRNDGGIDGTFLIIKKIDTPFLEKLAGGFNGVIMLSDGGVMVTSFAEEATPDAPEILTQTQSGDPGDALQPATIREDGVSYRILVAPLTASHSGAYALALAKNASIVDETRWQVFKWGMLFGLILIIFILFLIHFHIVEIFRPLQSLVASTQRIAAGNLDEPLEPEGAAEVYELAANFEIMRKRLQELLASERSLSENLEMRVQETSRALEDLCRAREHLLAQLISAQEEERRRVSRELHDETSQSLANFIVRLSTLSRLVDDQEVLAQLQVLRMQAAATLEGVNRIVMDLRPGLLDEYGLAPAVQWYADARLSENGVRVKMTIRGAQRELSSHAQASIYRIMQEAINNIAQHAQASHVQIVIDWQEDALRIEIQDDGRGFELQHALDSTKGHFGLLGMRERVLMLNGKMDIHTTPGQGTTLIFVIPYALNFVRKNDQN